MKRYSIHTPPYSSGRPVEDSDGPLVMFDDVQGLVLQLRECRAALDDLIQKKPGIEALLCGSTTLGNLRAELGNYKREVGHV